MPKKNFIFGCSTVRTKECYSEHGCFNERYKYIEDYSYNLKYLRAGEPIIFYDRIIVKHRSGGISDPYKVRSKYLRDENQIIIHEILPFSRNRIKVLKKHREWKKNIKKDQYKEIHGYLKRVIFKLYYAVCFPEEIKNYLNKGKR